MALQATKGHENRFDSQRVISPNAVSEERG
jgi:hypothetical protein